MERTQVESSNIASIGYDKGTPMTLEVEFHGGKVYRYIRVPADLYEGFLKAESKGKFFYANIRGKYSYELVEPKVKSEENASKDSGKN